MKEIDVTQEWQEYQAGIDYNTRINLYETVNKNERMYAGDQWAGVVSNGLPTPVFNIFKRIINFFIASIMSHNIALQYVPENVGDEPENDEEYEIKQASELVTQYSKTCFEKKKMNKKIRQWLLDAALTGDAVGYNFWNMDLETYQNVMGDIDLEEIDSVNLMFGNPNDRRVSKQPYILIVYRELVAHLREEAKKNSISANKIKLISSDENTFYQSGDRSKIELDRSGKTTAILKLWKQDGKVFAKKSVRQTEIRPKFDTKLSDYPVALMNWDQRKNSYHGQAVGTGLVPNQIFINKMFAMAMMSLMHTAFPKAIYDKNAIAGWNNQIGTAIGVEGAGGKVGDLAQYLTPGKMDNDVFQMIDAVISYTKDMLGASDAALGDVKPENTSAIIAVQQAAAVPLETIKQNLYQFIEDIGYIWLDFMANHYGKRKIDVEIRGKREVREFDFAKLKKMKFRIKVDVGPSSYWSQIAAIQTLDNLLQNDKITFLQYLERLPSGMIPKTQELIQDLQEQDLKQQFIWEQMARFMETLSPEEQAELQQLSPEQQEQQLMQMMMEPPQDDQPSVAEQQHALEQQKEQQKFEQQAELKKLDIAGKIAVAGLKGSGTNVQSS